MASQGFANKNVLIFGATSGIGRDTAVAFARAGAASVTITGRRPEQGAAVAAQIEAAGARAQFIAGDVTNEAHIQEAVAAVVSKFGALHVAFNNAGIEGQPGPITQVTAAEFDQVFAINVRGVLLAMKHEIAAMLASGGGAIVNNTSIVGSIGFANTAVYTASKHAVLGLTRVAALEYAQQGIRVNSVAPGPIETDMLDRFSGGNPQVMAAGNPSGRIGRGEEIAGAVLFLASDAASYVTGHDLLVDGGYTAT